MGSVRDQLAEGAAQIERHTRGFLKATMFDQIIDRGPMPVMPVQEETVHLFLPIVVSIDKSNSPVEFPDDTTATATGVVACLGDRALFAWMTGKLRMKFFNYVLPYADIKAVTPIKYGGLSGIDIEEKHTWTVLFGEQLDAQVVETYRDVLKQELRERAGLSAHGPAESG